MFELFLGCIMFSIGFAAGAWFKSMIYDNQPWEVFRWDAGTMGYRPIPLGSLLGRGDNVMMGLRLNSESFPTEGIRYEEDK